MFSSVVYLFYYNEVVKVKLSFFFKKIEIINYIYKIIYLNFFKNQLLYCLTQFQIRTYLNNENFNLSVML